MTPKEALKTLKKRAVYDTVIASWCGCTKQSVGRWKKIPPEHVLKLEAVPEVGMTRYQMRRDIFGAAPE